jgi:general secretion pathway protein C
MNTDHNGRNMASRLFALIVWAAVAASVAYWGLRWLSRPAAVPAHATPVSLDAAVRGDIHRLLAAPKVVAGVAQIQSEAQALAGRLKLLGVVASRNETDPQSVALLSMDGKPARAVRIGMAIDGGYVLRTLSQRSAGIGQPDGPVAVNLDLPLMPPPATGVQPPPTGVLQSPTMPSVAAMQGGAQTPPPAPKVEASIGYGGAVPPATNAAAAQRRARLGRMQQGQPPLPQGQGGVPGANGVLSTPEAGMPPPPPQPGT